MPEHYHAAPNVRPAPKAAERDRMGEQAFRRRVLTGRWHTDLEHAIRRAVGTKRADAWRLPDTSSNPARQFCNAVSELYTSAPTITHQNPEAAAVMQQVLMDAGWVGRMQNLQPLVVGVGEGILRVDVVDGQIVLREVDPSYVVAHGKPSERGQPYYVCEYRQRIDPTDASQIVWVREIWDSEAGTLTLLDEQDRDVTALHYGSAEYPYSYTDAEGQLRHVCPYVVWHRSDGGTEIFNPWPLSEIFVGTLYSGIQWSMYLHRLRSASWPQRYVVGLQPSGIEPSTSSVNGFGEGRRDVVVADPAVVLSLEPIEDMTGQPMVGAFPDGAPLSDYVDAVTTYDRHVISTAGLDASEIQRMDGDPRSGYALSLSAHGKRMAAARYRNSHARSDAMLCATVAQMLLATGVAAGLPLDGYGVEYTSLGLTTAEAQELAQQVTQLVGAGLLTVEEGRSKLAAAGYFSDVKPDAAPEVAQTEQSRNSYQISNLVAAGVLSPDEARKLLAAAGYFDPEQTAPAPELVLPQEPEP